jgi:hypothetical protein
MYNLGPSPPAIALKHLTSILFLKPEGKIKGVGPTVFHKKEWPT